MSKKTTPSAETQRLEYVIEGQYGLAEVPLTEAMGALEEVQQKLNELGCSKIRYRVIGFSKWTEL
jgi:hypothetical protein